MLERGGGLPRNDGGKSGVQGANVEGNGIRSGASGGPQGTCRSEIFGNKEEVAEGPASSCRATQRAKRTDPREVGCRLQEGVPPCSSGMA
jgi:hypothetical protein